MKLVINFFHLYIQKLLLTGNSSWRKSVKKSDEIDSKKFNQSIERQLKPDAIVASECGDCVILLGKWSPQCCSSFDLPEVRVFTVEVA